MSSIAVVHIAREAYEFAEFERFATSYNQYDAGIEHELFVVVKGLTREVPTNDAYLDKYRELLPRATFVMFGDVLFDLGCYAEISRYIDHEYVCFLNSKSEILVDEWLKKLVSILEFRPEAGIVGATGSWQEGLGERFPNPHIRTNGFAMHRQLFLHCTEGRKFHTKAACNEFEHGITGLSRQLERLKYELYVVDSNGRAYAQREWPASGTWRTTGEQSLLISDNRTREYNEVDVAAQRFLRGVTWYSFPTIQTLRNAQMGIPLEFVN